MTVAHGTPDHTWSSPATRRFGYTISIAINAGLLFVAHNILDWDILPWLTSAWEDVLPIVSLSLVASMVVNAMYLVYDAQWFKSITQVVTLMIGMLAAIQIFRVFPFDFSAYDFNWEVVAKAVLIIGIAGSAIGIVVEATKAIRALAQAGD